MTRYLYMAIENRVRELPSRLLIADHAARKGVTVVFGNQWLLNENLDRLPPGVVLFKGANLPQLNNMARAKSRGHATALIDEEALGICDADLLRRSISPGAEHLVDLVLTQGPWQDALMTGYGFKTRQTGNPRVDLLLDPSAYTAQADAIRADYGDFVLVNTNSAGINSAWGSQSAYRSVLANVGWMRADGTDEEMYREHIAADRLAVANVSAFIRAYSGPIVLRPHPAERADSWTRADLPENVTVVTDTDPIPWLLAAKAVVVTGCTTGVEATILGVPALDVGDSRFLQRYLASQVCWRAPDGTRAAEIVPDLNGGSADRDFFRDRWSAWINDTPAAERVAVELSALTNATPEGLPDIVAQSERTEYQKRKMSATADDVHRQAALLGLDLKIKPIGDSLFTTI